MATIRRRARVAGQEYLRDQALALTSRMSSAEAWRLVEGSLSGVEPGPSRDEVLDATRDA
ncbi:hypothetical protein [Amycolatopsis jejuensis]|uniref:hypothetical protein n=1 Tax=Amycolatopsis jejuensis TaxID=330084 RepID=UPI000A6CDBCC|nr:hypothetical protein [Amycolatopsis jejuensis]